jgi:acyl-CoA reductase-like NAD-dependent aldehyde dehydrogenase
VAIHGNLINGEWVTGADVNRDVNPSNVHEVVGVDYHVPFGGRKGSSYGPREQGAYAREFYTSVKTSYTA